jgi:hypothetical protein
MHRDLKHENGKAQLPEIIFKVISFLIFPSAHLILTYTKTILHFEDHLAGWQSENFIQKIILYENKNNT